MAARESMLWSSVLDHESKLHGKELFDGTTSSNCSDYDVKEVDIEIPDGDLLDPEPLMEMGDDKNANMNKEIDCRPQFDEQPETNSQNRIVVNEQQISTCNHVLHSRHEQSQLQVMQMSDNRSRFQSTQQMNQNRSFILPKQQVTSNGASMILPGHQVSDNTGMILHPLQMNDMRGSCDVTTNINRSFYNQEATRMQQVTLSHFQPRIQMNTNLLEEAFTSNQIQQYPLDLFQQIPLNHMQQRGSMLPAHFQQLLLSNQAIQAPVPMAMEGSYFPQNAAAHGASCFQNVGNVVNQNQSNIVHQNQGNAMHQGEDFYA